MTRMMFAILLGSLSIATRLWPEWDGFLGWASMTPGEAKILAGVYLTGALVLIGSHPKPNNP